MKCHTASHSLGQMVRRMQRQRSCALARRAGCKASQQTSPALSGLIGCGPAPLLVQSVGLAVSGVRPRATASGSGTPRPGMSGRGACAALHKKGEW